MGQTGTLAVKGLNFLGGQLVISIQLQYIHAVTPQTGKIHSFISSLS